MNVSSLIETSTSSSSGIGGQAFALDFELHKMKLGGKGKPSELPQVYSRKVAVSATSALRTKETLTFGKTATIVVTLERVATEVVDTLTASSSQPLTPAQAPGFRVKEEARALAEVAAALRDKASAALEGSVSHKFLSQWGSVLAEVGQNLAPLISCLPFGEVLVSAAAGLFSAVMGRGAVLELGVDVCGQTALVLRVLCQPQVLKLIISDPSTHHLLERLVELLKQTVSILEDYNQSGVLYQLWKASGKLECIQQKSDDIRSLFTSLHQLTTFRAHAAHANDLQSVLEVVNAMQVLTAEGLSEHLLPQLTWLINSSEARAQTAVAASGKSVNEALMSMKTQLSADLNKMARDVLSVKSLQEKQGDVAAGMVTTINTAVGDAAALISSNMKTVVEASASTTLSVLSATMKSLLNEVIHSAIPAAWKGDPMEEIEQRLRTVIEGAWTGALTVQLTKATEQVNAHTKDAVRQATICIGTRLDSLSVALTAAVESSEVALKYLQRTLQQHVSAELQLVGTSGRRASSFRPLSERHNYPSWIRLPSPTWT